MRFKANLLTLAVVFMVSVLSVSCGNQGGSENIALDTNRSIMMDGEDVTCQIPIPIRYEHNYVIPLDIPQPPRINNIQGACSGIYVEWQEISNADRYFVKYRDENGYETTVDPEDVDPNFRYGEIMDFTIPDLVEGEAYDVCVMAWNTDGMSGCNDSNPVDNYGWQFDSEALGLGIPSGLALNSDGETINMSWNRVDCADDGYEIEINNDGYITYENESQTILDMVTHSYNAIGGETYNIRVRSLRGSDVSDWGPVETITPEGPQLVLDKDEFTFGCLEGDGEYNPTDTLTITNEGGGTLSWISDISGDITGKISINPDYGYLSSGQYSNVNFSVDCSAAGNFEGTIRISDPSIPIQEDVSVTLSVSAGWEHPVDLNDNLSIDGYESDARAIAMDDSGNAIIVWDGYDASGDRQVYKAEFRNGVWVLPSSINDHISFSGTDAHYPHVAMDNNGNAIIVWVQEDTNTYDHVYKAEYRNGTWSYPTNINDHISLNTTFTFAAASADVAMGDNGDAVIVWRQFVSGIHWQIFKSEYRNGSWDHPNNFYDNISPDGHAAGTPKVEMADNGDTIIIWTQYANDDLDDFLYKSTYFNGTWTHPAGFGDHVNFASSEVTYGGGSVAMDNNGNAIIVWRQANQYGWSHIYKSEYRDGVWHNPSSLYSSISPTTTGNSFQKPIVAMDDNGNAIIAYAKTYWENYTDGIYKSEYRDGSWTHASIEDNISPESQALYGVIGVAMNDLGNAIITWDTNDITGHPNKKIFMSEYRNSSWDHPDDIYDFICPDGTAAYYPKAVMNDIGDAMITWSQYSDDGKRHVFKSEYHTMDSPVAKEVIGGGKYVRYEMETIIE